MRRILIDREGEAGASLIVDKGRTIKATFEHLGHRAFVALWPSGELRADADTLITVLKRAIDEFKNDNRNPPEFENSHKD